MDSHMKPAAVKATFADYKRIRGRKQGQLIFEIPLEQLHSAIAALGGEPSVEQDTWVAIARLTAEAAAQQPEKERRRFDELKPAQQAALACQREAFQRFLVDQFDNKVMGEESAAAFVRGYCVVQSRAEIGNSDESLRRWNRLYSLFRIWFDNPDAERDT